MASARRIFQKREQCWSALTQIIHAVMLRAPPLKVLSVGFSMD
jgi:hypothetical protein